MTQPPSALRWIRSTRQGFSRLSPTRRTAFLVIPLLVAVVVVVIVFALNGRGSGWAGGPGGINGPAENSGPGNHDVLGVTGLPEPVNATPPTPSEPAELSDGPAAAGQVCAGISREILAIPPSRRSASEILRAVRKSDLSAASNTGSGEELMVLNRLVAYLAALRDTTSLRTRKDDFLEASEAAGIGPCVDLARALPPTAATR